MLKMGLDTKAFILSSEKIFSSEVWLLYKIFI